MSEVPNLMDTLLCEKTLPKHFCIASSLPQSTEVLLKVLFFRWRVDGGTLCSQEVVEMRDLQGHRQGLTGPRPWFLAARPDNQGRARASVIEEARQPGPGSDLCFWEARPCRAGPGLT